VGDDFIGRLRAVGLAASQLSQHAADHGHAAGPAHQTNAVGLIPRSSGLPNEQRCSRLRAFEKVGRHFFKLAAADLDAGADAGVKVMRRRLGPLRSRVFGRLGVEPELGGVLWIAPWIDAMRVEELLGQMMDEPFVKVLAAQADVPIGGQCGKAGPADLEDRHVERSASQVVDQNPLGLLGRVRFAEIEETPRAAVGDVRTSEPNSNDRR
jgi:hypothetical protein